MLFYSSNVQTRNNGCIVKLWTVDEVFKVFILRKF